jgi:A/G-specific adenine glycosylase
LKTAPKQSPRWHGFQSALDTWYRSSARRLPWRDNPSVYKTVVSEFMLQQTQVATVLPYFDRWMREFPDFATLATAPAERVLKLWEGLGYYSRARNLHRLAQMYVAATGEIRSPAQWRELPGIGPYTAAAITSISFGERIACVDGNVVRILARLTDDHREFRDSGEAAKEFTALANDLVSAPDPGTHNQAMMELGATVCVRQNPRCDECPVARFCAARRAGTAASLPRLKPKRIEQREVTRVWCLHEGKLLLRRGAAGAKRLADLHELPEAADLLLEPDSAAFLLRKRRAITRFQITELIYRAKATPTLRRTVADSSGALLWIAVDALDQITLSGPHKRWIAELL